MKADLDLAAIRSRAERGHDLKPSVTRALLDRLEQSEATVDAAKKLIGEVFRAEDYTIIDWQRYENQFMVELLDALDTGKEATD